MTNAFLDLRLELRNAAARRIARRRRRRLTGTLLVAVGMTGAGVTVAATDWGIGDPAPPAVERDFAEYPSQVGLDPKPDGAFLAARDGEDYALYAVENRQGGYCLTVTAPWRNPAEFRGSGTCVTRKDAAEPIAVGVVASGKYGPDGKAPHLVAGRVLNPNARVIRFATVDGDPVERALGAGGFFLAALEIEPCAPNQNWDPVFVALNENGRELERVRITLMVADQSGACGFEVSPHGPYKFDKQ